MPSVSFDSKALEGLAMVESPNPTRGRKAGKAKARERKRGENELRLSERLHLSVLTVALLGAQGLSVHPCISNGATLINAGNE